MISNILFKCVKGVGRQGQSWTQPAHRTGVWRMADVVTANLDQGLMRLVLNRKLVKLGFV